MYDSMYASASAFSPSYKLVNTDKFFFSVQMTSVMKAVLIVDYSLYIYMTHVAIIIIIWTHHCVCV